MFAWPERSMAPGALYAKLLTAEATVDVVVRMADFPLARFEEDRGSTGVGGVI